MKKIYHRILIFWSHFKNKPWNEILDRWFNQISFLEQDGERKKEISIDITEGIEHSRLYWLQIVLSALIATLGLLQNSAAIIIGAMLIAPFFKPIQAMAFGIALGRMNIFWRASKMLFLSILLSIFIGYFVSLQSPVILETSEIIARTNPNLFDLIIAAASAMVAFLALGYKKLLESVAGVAMATSLMPPLAVSGISLALYSADKAFGSFLLFTTNLVAILMVGSLMFFVFGFTPHQDQSTNTLKRVSIILTSVLILWIPLFSSLKQIEKQHDLQKTTQTVINTQLKKLSPYAETKTLSLKSFNKKLANISAEIKIPENVEITNWTFQEIHQELETALKQKIELEIITVRTTVLD